MRKEGNGPGRLGTGASAANKGSVCLLGELLPSAGESPAQLCDARRGTQDPQRGARAPRRADAFLGGSLGSHLRCERGFSSPQKSCRGLWSLLLSATRTPLNYPRSIPEYMAMSCPLQGQPLHLSYLTSVFTTTPETICTYKNKGGNISFLLLCPTMSCPSRSETSRGTTCFPPVLPWG